MLTNQWIQNIYPFKMHGIIARSLYVVDFVALFIHDLDILKKYFIGKFDWIGL